MRNCIQLVDLHIISVEVSSILTTVCSINQSGCQDHVTGNQGCHDDTRGVAEAESRGCPGQRTRTRALCRLTVTTNAPRIFIRQDDLSTPGVFDAIMRREKGDSGGPVHDILLPTIIRRPAPNNDHNPKS